MKSCTPGMPKIQHLIQMMTGARGSWSARNCMKSKRKCNQIRRDKIRISDTSKKRKQKCEIPHTRARPRFIDRDLIAMLDASCSATVALKLLHGALHVASLSLQSLQHRMNCRHQKGQSPISENASEKIVISFSRHNRLPLLDVNNASL